MQAISVIVPTYNRVGLIAETLDAVRAQTHPAHETIVVDDGSTDGTADLVAIRYPAVRLIRIPNGGDLAARNAGVRIATGELLAFCDSDDLWRPGFLAAMAQLWQLRPDLLAAYADFQAIRDGVWEARTKFDAAPPGFWDGAAEVAPGLCILPGPAIDRLLRFQPFFPSAMAAHRARFRDAGGWDESVSRVVGTDFATALRMAAHDIGVVRRPLVGIRRHAANFSGDMQAMNLGEAVILERLLAAWPGLAPHRAAVLGTMADRRAAAADLAFDHRDFAAVRSIHALLPPSHRTPRRRLKHIISRCPPPLARAALQLVTK